MTPFDPFTLLIITLWSIWAAATVVTVAGVLLHAFWRAVRGR